MANYKHEPWRKKEPGARLSEKQKVNVAKGIVERAQMEQNANRPYSLRLFDPWSLKISGISDASVYLLSLKKPMELLELYKRLIDAGFSLEPTTHITISMKKKLPILEIYSRMDKAFESLSQADV